MTEEQKGATVGAGEITRVYPAWKIAEITAKYSMSFKCDYGKCQITHADGKFQLDTVGEVGAEFYMLITEIEELARKTEVLDQVDVFRFLYKYSKMKLRMARELERSPISEGELSASNFQPLDLDTLPLGERAVAELLQDHCNASDRVDTFTLTKEAFDAKIEEIKRRQKC